MPVSPSTIAFALVTCIPFGLAIRDTVEHRQPTTPSHHADELDSEDEAREARMRAEQAVRDAAREAEIQHHKLMLIDLIGPGPAQLGRSFDGITLGMTAAEFEQKRDLIADLRTQTAATIRGDSEAILHALWITPHLDSCAFVGEQLDRRWGAGHRAGNRTFWGAGDTRAVFERNPSGDCELTFEERVDVARWVDKKAGSVVPLALIGKPVKALLADIAARASAEDVEQDEESIQWRDAGVGNGLGRTSLMAVIEHGKVAWLEARTDVDRDTTTAIQDRLTALYGAPAGDDTLTWSRAKLTLTLGDESSIVVTAGTLPR
jgi:hypothetical protein